MIQSLSIQEKELAPIVNEYLFVHIMYLSTKPTKLKKIDVIKHSLIEKFLISVCTFIKLTITFFFELLEKFH